VNIHYNEPFVEYNHKGTPVRLYRDVNMTERHSGGLPPALMTGRTAVQYLCRDTNTLFISEE
jgi:hypothetical protein